MSDEIDWKSKLTPEQYRVLRDKGTEAPSTGLFLHRRLHTEPFSPNARNERISLKVGLNVRV